MTIKTVNLTKRYGATVALNNLNIDLPHRHFSLLNGPPGAGKTTALLIMGTLLVPTWGECRVGEWITSYQRYLIRPHIGFVPNDAAIHDDLTVREDFSYFAKGMRAAGYPVRADNIAVAELVALAGEIDVPCKELAPVQRKQLALGRSLLRRPQLLFIDSLGDDVLDDGDTLKLCETLAAIFASGISILLSARDDRWLLAGCTYRLLLDQGELISVGAVS